MIYTMIVMTKHKIAYFSEVNLNIFMADIIRQVAITSLTIQFLLLNHHPQQNPTPMTTLIISIVLKVKSPNLLCEVLNIYFLKNALFLNKNNI